ncbi:MAG TPA: PQQ-binding-like beta-propeller repeat protein [Nocardioidaceae bacterium]|nr:PQQ-binding-like beta-propeller repeat protein [Nocardioidaceae bacterium]
MMEHMRRGLVAVLLLILVTAGCSSGGGSDHAASTASGSSPGSSATGSSPTANGTSRFENWPTYHRTPSRSGRAASTVSAPLEGAWSEPLRGAVYGEPLVVDGLLIVATEGNNVYGIDPASGQVQWQTNFGTPMPLSELPCGDIDPLGITSTPAYDPRTGSVFVVAETTGAHHTLWAIDPATGHKRWQRSLDTQPDRNPFAEQQRSALLVTHGRVITTFGGLAGDCGNYVGYVTSAPVGGRGAIHSYAVPTPREAGMWSPAGPVVGPNGNVYVAAGNGAKTSGAWDKSDSVTELTPVSLHAVSVFAPSTWRQDNAADLDLGSSSPVPVSDRIVIAGKRGTVYLLEPQMSGVGSAIRQLDGCTAFGGAARAGPHTLLMPCLGEDAIKQLQVGRQHLSFGWTASGMYASPVVAGSYVLVADRDTGDLVVLRLSDGSTVQRIHAGPLTHFPSVTVSGGMVFVPTLNGITAFRGA